MPIFITRVGDEILFGIDLVGLSQEGKITDFMIMMRFAHTVLMLAAEAGSRGAARQTLEQ